MRDYILAAKQNNNLTNGQLTNQNNVQGTPAKPTSTQMPEINNSYHAGKSYSIHSKFIVSQTNNQNMLKTALHSLEQSS